MTAIVIDPVTLEPRDLRAVKGVWQSLRRWAYAPFIVLAIGIISTIILVGEGEIQRPILLPIIGVQLVTLYLWMALSLWLQKHAMSLVWRSPATHQTTRWSIDDEGLTISHPLGQTWLRWSAIVEAVEPDDRFVFALSPYSNVVLPSRCLTEDQAVRLRDLIVTVHRQKRLGVIRSK